MNISKKRVFGLHFENKKGKTLIFSLPQSNQYHIIERLQLSNNNVIEDWVWKNKVVVSANSDLYISFRVKMNEIDFSIPDKLTVKNYSRVPKLLILPNRFVNGKDTKIISLAQKAAGNEQTLKSIVQKLYDFTLNYLTYGKPIDGLHSYKQAMGERITDCGGFSTFLASLLQSVGIPSRLVVGFFIKENVFVKLFSRFDFCALSFDFLMMHAWLEILLPDHTWFPLDPSIESRRRRQLTGRQGGYGYIPADRLVTSFGQDFEIKINEKKYKIDLLQKPVYINC